MLSDANAAQYVACITLFRATSKLKVVLVFTVLQQEAVIMLTAV